MGNFSFYKKEKKPTEYDGAERVLSDKTPFDTIETYKSMRTNIMFSMPKTDRGKVIVITSASPGEGKTTTSINLAITFAQTGAKVLLIDCDLRKARVHRYLNLKRKSGVSNVLCGFTDFDRAVKKNIRQNLDCLTSGEIPPNPAELLETGEFSNLLERVKDEYDYIFIDTPPLTVVTDAVIVMRYCTGAVVVARQNVTTYDLLDTAMTNIRKTGVKILGFAVLDSNEKAKRYRYYRSRKYGYRYGGKYGYKYKYDYKYGDDAAEKK